MKYPQTIDNLIECFKKYPGVGEKSAERFALATLDLNQESIDLFSTTLKNTKIKIKHCKKCNNLTEEEFCSICRDKTRNQNLLCIVEESKNINLFEKTGSYNGLYHVLGGLISPLDEINPNDIKIQELMDRIEKEKIKEVILALKLTVEGETTSLYISNLLTQKDVKVSKIAHGIPMGADMDYLDPLTIEMAINGRTIIE